MARILYPLINLGLDLVWRFRPKDRSRNELITQSPIDSDREEIRILRSLIQRFPFWIRGRALLARRCIDVDDIATAYAEAQALRLVSPERSAFHTTSLALLGECYLRRGDGAGALSLLTQASDLSPHDLKIREDKAAAHVLVGEKAKAFEILKAIPATNLSAEGKAALQWLSSNPS